MDLETLLVGLCIWVMGLVYVVLMEEEDEQ